MAGEQQRELFPIRTVSSLTGVNAVTLRAWERRHGLVRPQRTPKGHRLYSREDIDLINRILALLDKGVSIGQVRAALERQDRAGHEGGGDAWYRYRQRMIAAIIRFDESALEDTYNEALSLHSIGDVTAKLVVPLLRELGTRWEATEGSVAEEHFFSVYLRNKLGARFHHRPRNARGPRLLCSCLPGEEHVVGLLLFALTAAEQGFRVVLLGANLPLEELPLAQRRSESDCIVLSGAMEPAEGVLEHQLSRLVQRVDVPVIVGGVCSVRRRDLVERAGAVAVGEDIEKGVERLQEVLKAHAT